jgi:hypothetical protein
MKIDWNFIALLIGIVVGTFTICGYLWKINRFLGAKSKSVDTRIHALYEIIKLQAAQFEEITDYLVQDAEQRGRFRIRKGLPELKAAAFKEYQDEHIEFK